MWHCGTGKDRTGIGTAFLLSLLGVEEDVIYEDYLRTNRYMEPKLVYMQRLVQTWPEADEKMTLQQNSVRQQSLRHIIHKLTWMVSTII